MNSSVPWTALCCLLAFPGTLPADLLPVPSGYPTIQDAIDQSAAGDTVLVSPGFYLENIDFLGKAVTVVSEEGPSRTTIHGGGTGSVVSFQSEEGPGSMIEGFTITGGTGTYGGGYTYGGGVYCWSASPTIRANVITGNSANYHGGGIYCLLSDSAVIAGNTIFGNRAHNGAGIYCSAYSYPWIGNNAVFSNTAELDGGGIYCNYYSDPFITNNTITMNDAGYGGGGIYCYGSSPVVLNTILWGNDAPSGPEIYLGDWLYPSHMVISYSDVEGGEDEAYIQSQCTLTWGSGMIDSDPAFVLAGSRDYRLLWGSPCIDSGHPDSLDVDGTRRDIGRYDFDQDDFLTLYLTPDKTRVPQGGELGVTYTLINRWEQAEMFFIESRITLPGGYEVTIHGPAGFELPAGHTTRVFLIYDIPREVPCGVYRYSSTIEPPLLLYDQDSFDLRVTKFPAAHREAVPW